jgi:GNAT superfamily N-acetyltransferase
LAALLAELGYPADSAAVRDRLARLTARSDVAVFVADDGSAEAGLATVHVIPCIHVDEPMAMLSALVVGERHRGRGIGRGLVTAAERWAIERGAPRMTLVSGLARRDAHAFYERLGYEHTGRRYSKMLT